MAVSGHNIADFDSRRIQLLMPEFSSAFGSEKGIDSVAAVISVAKYRIP